MSKYKLRKGRVALAALLATSIPYAGKEVFFSTNKKSMDVSEKLEELSKCNPEEALQESLDLVQQFQVPEVETPEDIVEEKEEELDTLFQKTLQDEDFLMLCRLFDYSSRDAYDLIYNYYFATGDYPTMDKMTELFLDRSGLKERAGEEVYQYLLNDRIGQSILKNSLTYGVDPLLMYSLCKQESNLDHYNHIVGEGDYTGTAYGVTQQEKTTIGGTYQGYNVITGNVDKVTTTKENLKDLDTNVQLATMKIQSYLKKYQGNIVIALICYNYGGARGSDVVEAAATDYGVSPENLCTQPNAISLILKHGSLLNENPSDYFDTTREDYGDGEYAIHVCQKSPTRYLYGLKDNVTNQITVLDTKNADHPKYMVTSIDDYEQAIASKAKTYIKK